MADRYYFITGRIPGDDEDTGLPVGQHPDKEAAIHAYKLEMYDLNSMDEAEVESLRSCHGTAVFINSVVASDSPIEDAS